MALRASDLMVGDWVYMEAHRGYEAQNIQVATIPDASSKDHHGHIGAFPVGGDNDFRDIEDRHLFPIPLTPEILEKNGFEFGYTASEEDFCAATGCGYPEEKGWCYDEGAGEIKIIFPNNTDGGLIRLDDQSWDRHLELIFVKPIMVHVLQHCLKLVGIKREIEL